MRGGASLHIITIKSNRENILFISTATARLLALNLTMVDFHIGVYMKRMQVIKRDTLADYTVGISSATALPFELTPRMDYDFFIEGHRLYVGPVIAIIISKARMEQLEAGSLKDYFIHNPARKGLLFVCVYDGIKRNEQVVEGCSYETQGTTESWRSGAFPYPNAFYRRVRLNDEEIFYISGPDGTKLFNAYPFNKREMSETLYHAGFDALPYTRTLNSLDTLRSMLRQYPEVYLKPSFGSMARGIFKISKCGAGYHVQASDGCEYSAKRLEDAYRVFREQKSKGLYLVQRAIRAKHAEVHVDFRVIFQKGAGGRWSITGMIAKYGMAGRICTNQVSSISTGSDALMRMYGMNKEQVCAKEKEIAAVCERACMLLEEVYGDYGDVGIDLVMDVKQRIWLLEVNILHQHDIARFVDEDPAMYTRLLAKPIEYAKRISGFL